jgi:hypothetical protein
VVRKVTPAQFSTQFFPFVFSTNAPYSSYIFNSAHRDKAGEALGLSNKNNALQEIEQHEERELLLWNFQV